LILLDYLFSLSRHTHTGASEMNVTIENAAEIRPDLMRRTCGGWLAVAPSSAKIRIGATGTTEAEAIETFRFVYSRWIELFKPKTLDVPK
jgi:hypothetical protein